jgi:hypothetical protein
VKTDKFQGNLLRLLDENPSMTNPERGTEDLNAILSKRANEGTDIEKLVQEFLEVLKAVCDKSFRRQQATRKIITNKSVPW